MRLLISILLLLSVVRAPGYLLIQAYVRDDGWSADLVFSNSAAAVGGTYEFYLQTNRVYAMNNGSRYTNWWNSPTASTPRFNVFVPGFTTAGVSNWTERVVYCVSQVRSNYPNQAVRDERLGGTEYITNRVSLSDFVAQPDMVTSFYAPNGVYTQAATPSTGATLQPTSATNLSQIPYPVGMIGRIARPGWNLITNAVLKTHAIGFSQFATNFEQLAAMQFIYRGQDGVAVTNLQTRTQIDRTLMETIPTGEYVDTVNLLSSGFANSNLIRTDITGFPWRGDRSWSTVDDRYLAPTNFPCAHTNFYMTNAYSVSAVVATNGNNATARAFLFSDPTTVVAADCFTNINAALNAIQASNNTIYGHADVGGGVVWVRAGIDNGMAGSATMGSTPKVRVRVFGYPGDPRPQIVFRTGSSDISDRIHYKGLDLTIPAGTFFLSSSAMPWLQDCTLAGTTTSFVGGTSPMVEITDSTFDALTGGFGVVAGAHTYYALIRNTRFVGRGGGLWWAFIGNTISNVPAAFGMGNDHSGIPGLKPDFQIFYNNWCSFSNITCWTLMENFGITNGVAVAQNVIENSEGASSYTFGQKFCTNVIHIQNTFEGARLQYLYDNTDVFLPHWWCQSFNNSFNSIGEATDTDTGNENAIDTGDWPVRWRVGSRGNLWRMVETIGEHGAIQGINILNYHPGATPTTVNRSSTNWIAYVDGRGATQSADGPRWGNYRMRSLHPTYTPTSQVLRYDLDGHARSVTDPPGSYSHANRNGQGFF